MRKVRLAYLVTHPIQYQAPLLRLVAAQPDLDLTVFFQSDISVGEYHDPGFGQSFRWDVDLLTGYSYKFLPKLNRGAEVTSWRPISYGIVSQLVRGKFDVLWLHGYARWFNLLAALAARCLGITVLVRDEATDISAPRSVLRTLLKRLYFFVLAKAVHGFLAIGCLNRLYYQGYGIPASRIFDVPYCVDNVTFQEHAKAAEAGRERLREALGLDADRAVILFASKFQPRKRPDDLLEAYIKLSALLPHDKIPHLLFIGNGELLAALQRRSLEANCRYVQFLGFKNQSELPRYFDLCDALVLPSVHEPWGLIVNEVMNAGRIVIVSDQVGCAADLVKPGANGFIYRAGDIAALCEVMQTVALMRQGERRAMGERGREIVSQWNFDRDLAGLRGAIAALCK